MKARTARATQQDPISDIKRSVSETWLVGNGPCLLLMILEP